MACNSIKHYYFYNRGTNGLGETPIKSQHAKIVKGFAWQEGLLFKAHAHRRGSG